MEGNITSRMNGAKNPEENKGSHVLIIKSTVWENEKVLPTDEQERLLTLGQCLSKKE